MVMFSFISILFNILQQTLHKKMKFFMYLLTFTIEILNGKPHVLRSKNTAE